MHGLSSLIRRFGRDESGVFAVIFGLMAIVLVALGGAVVDYVSLEQTRSRSQVALDAAALALHSRILVTTPDKAKIQSDAQALVNDRVGQSGIVVINNTVIDKTQGSLYFTANMTVNTFFVNLVGVKTLSANIQSEVKRGSMDVEVSVAVDITGSMNDTVPKAGSGWQTETKIDALERALGQLIDLVVKDSQTPSYSKMAIVPYSMGVNVGSTWAPTIRGAVKAPTAITAITWSTGGDKTATDAVVQNSSNGYAVEVTSNNHGFVNNDYIYVSPTPLFQGMSQIGNTIFQVAYVDANKFRLKDLSGNVVNGRYYGSYNKLTPYTVTKCLVSTCELVVQSANHGLAAGANVYISGVRGMNSYSAINAYNRYNQYPTSDSTAYNWINNQSVDNNDYRFLVWQIGAVATNTFVLSGTARTNGKNYGTYTSGGTAACVTAGCQYYLYQNRYSSTNTNTSWRLQQISTCATERTTNGLSDASPATTLIGRNYPTAANACPDVVIQPLTSNKTVLHALADDLPAVGSTAGHLGIAWGWYMVSPNFSGPWPAASQPAPKTEKNVIRAVVLMTDGAFNTSYCNGVISQISGTGSGDENTKINCDPANGDSFTQAQKLCDAMKAADPPVRIYTVAFDVGDIQAAKDIMANCATDSSYAFEATTGADLASAFSKIGENLSYLRVTR
ncbi:Flp pilus assembly protein TadG [Devosia sp. YR412]|uniref:TadE/TadG family type IV pilus assembly protein n=1 Tax=Devosia sp. YR412 TaxID=1881030 RepID=UPI0008B52C71|nr:pilus assembly protein TadG-related protein [Devosia sp. YR412]SEP86265.1 Flp pilus assembly protein TadG [Devosia sp. YR412]